MAKTNAKSECQETSAGRANAEKYVLQENYTRRASSGG